MTHHHLPLAGLLYEFSRHVPARLHIQPGDTVTVDTEDAFSGQIRGPGDRRDRTRMPYSNPLTGPLAVAGAEPGDALAIRIHSIEPLLGQCATRTGEARMLAEWLGDDCPHGAHVCPIREGLIHWSDTLTIPYKPMLGCLGTAPALGSPTTLPAGDYGGNLDLIEVAPGNTVFLPVFVPGGWLYLGDAHAAMGHGELSGSGLEMPARSTIAIDLVKQANLPGPRIESPHALMAVASGTPLERSVAQAYARLITWLERDYGWNRWLAYDLLTHVGAISLGYYAVGAVAAKVDKTYVRR